MVSKFDRIFMLSPNSLAYRCRMGVGKIMVPRPFALYSITTACHWMAWPAHTRTKNKDKAQFVCIIVYHWVRERFFFCFFLFFSWYRMSDYKRHVLCMNEVYVYGNLIQKRKKKVWLELLIELENYTAGTSCVWYIAMPAFIKLNVVWPPFRQAIQCWFSSFRNHHHYSFSIFVSCYCSIIKLNDDGWWMVAIIVTSLICETNIL